MDHPIKTTVASRYARAAMAAAVAGLGVAGSIRLVHAAAGDRTWPYYAYAPDVCEDDPPKKKAVPVPPLQILYGGTRSDALGMLASLGVENAEKSLPKDKEAVRISNNSWVVAAGDHPVHEWLLALKDPAGPDRMFVAAWVKDGTYYIEVGYAVAQDNNPTHESGFLLMGNATPSVVAEIVKRVQAALPNLAKNPERYKPRACVRLLQWEDMVSGQTADALRASERERQAAENRQIDSSSPVYTLAAYGVKTHGRSYRAPTCSPVLGITPSVLTEAAKDTKPRGCRNSLLTSCPDWWSISCTYEVPERLLVETMKKLVQDGLRFRLGTVGNTPKTEELVASATTKYERIVCAQPPDAEVPVAWHDEDVDCGKVAEKAEEEFLSDVPSPEDILLAIKTHKPCKLAMTEIEWRRISSNVAPSKKDRKPATCGNRDFLISYPIVVHDGTKKNYGARECSGISAFTDDNAGERQFYTLGFTVRNKATTTMSLAIQDFLFVARDPGSPLSADTISIAKYHPRATRLACQDAHVRVDAGEEEEIEITYLSAKHRPWLLVNPKAGLYIDISDTVFEDPSRMMRGHPDHGIKAQ